MSVFQRFSEWATIQKFGAVADLLFKFTALVAALAAANFFYFQPDVRLKTTAQAFIDEAALSRQYAAAHEQMPEVVAEAAAEYNRLNAIDLDTGRNSTLGRLRVSEVCARMRERIEDVFRGADCSATRLVLGRGRYYERLLVALNDRARDDLGVRRLQEAIERIRKAEYLRARCVMRNEGSAKAENVRVRVSEGYAPRARSSMDNAGASGSNDAFFLHEGKQTYRLFETARGDYDPRPSLEFDVDWDRADLADSGIISWLVIVLLAAFVLVVINDIAAALRAKRDGDRKGN